jgi:hypothetical protein
MLVHKTIYHVYKHTFVSDLHFLHISTQLMCWASNHQNTYRNCPRAHFPFTISARPWSARPWRPAPPHVHAPSPCLSFPHSILPRTTPSLSNLSLPRGALGFGDGDRQVWIPVVSSPPLSLSLPYLFFLLSPTHTPSPGRTPRAIPWLCPCAPPWPRALRPPDRAPRRLPWSCPAPSRSRPPRPRPAPPPCAPSHRRPQPPCPLAARHGRCALAACPLAALPLPRPWPPRPRLRGQF